MPHSPDIIVVGAGIIGCAVASELARRGASVQVIDGRSPGMGATQASAGMLAPYNEAHEGSPLFDLTVRSLHMYDEFVAGAISESGLTVRYARSGSLDVATDQPALGRLRDLAGELSRQGVRAELLDAQAMRGEEPHLAPDAIGGLLIHTQGFVAASELTLALAAAARRRGVLFADRSAATRIACAGGHAAVDTEQGTLEADAVVLAAGSWSGSIALDAVVRRVPLNPVRGQLLQLAWTGEPLRRILWGPRCYCVPWDDGTVLVGATVEDAGFEERTTVAGVRELTEAVCGLLPRAIDAGFLGARAGLRPGTADGLPIIGRSRILPRLMYATGHYRNGVLLAPVTARAVADALLDDRTAPELAPFSPARFGDV